MSDSVSTDSDEGIRYKTESVRNKTEKVLSNKRYKDVYHEDQTSSRYKKRYSRSPSTKRSSYKTPLKHKKRRKKRNSSRSSSTSSSDGKNKSKSTKKESRQKDKNYSPKSESHLRSETPSVSLNDPCEAIQKEIIGPALPPHLLVKTTNSHITKNTEESSLLFNKTNQNPREDKNKTLDNISGPQPPFGSSTSPKLPPQIIMDHKLDLFIGPSLPTNLTVADAIEQDQPTLKDTSSFQPTSYIGPQLPPHLIKSNKISEFEQTHKSAKQVFDSQLLPSSSSKGSQENDSIKVIGPCLPPHLRKQLQEEGESHCLESNTETEEEDIYGPLPIGISNNSSSHQALEERALQLKIDQLEPKGSNEPVRETWMLELPAAKAANFGLGSRQFRNRSGPDMSDRSSWTDLPGDKEKKKSADVPMDLKEEAEIKEMRKRDKEQEMLTKKLKRKEESLLKMHEEKLKKEKKDEGPSERRPFSRDIDLQVNRFDEAQKKAIMKKAQLLDDRFSSGKTKFL